MQKRTRLFEIIEVSKDDDRISDIYDAFMLLVMARTKNLWNKGFYIVSAILSIIFGVLTIAHPFGFVKWFIILSGIIALVFGLIMMMFAFAVHRADREAEKEKVEEVKVEVIEEPKAEE